MLKDQIQQIVNSNPEYASIIPVVEKEILHHDIMDAMIKQIDMQSLTFIGGTSLRLCYNSSRLSEDLDFNAGHDFKPSHFDGLEIEIQKYIQNKYATEVWVNKPNEDKQGDTSSWKISIVKEANRPDLPRQKMHIDICAIPSFDIEKRALLNHYDIAVPTEGLLVPVQSLKETLADKCIALAFRSRRIKPRDVWDILWIKQRGINISPELIENKLEARGRRKGDFKEALHTQMEKIMHNDEVRNDFNIEMNRFIPNQIKMRTIDNPDYWPYVRVEIKDISESIFNSEKVNGKFDMGL